MSQIMPHAMEIRGDAPGGVVRSQVIVQSGFKAHHSARFGVRENVAGFRRGERFPESRDTSRLST
jgi:hypothetical protein